MNKSQSVNVRIVSAEVVREWAAKRGIAVAEHGRLSAEVVAAFNKAHKAQSYVVTRSQPARVVKVAGTRSKGNRKYGFTVETTYPAVRKWATAAGFSLGSRGRIPAQVMSAYAERGV